VLAARKRSLGVILTRGAGGPGGMCIRRSAGKRANAAPRSGRTTGFADTADPSAANKPAASAASRRNTPIATLQHEVAAAIGADAPGAR
jgi:hypothetical protein